MTALPEKTVALVVGVEKYAVDDPDWQLDGPALDACRFAHWLSEMRVPMSNITLLVSPLESNRENVEALSSGFASGTADRATVRAAITTDLSATKSDLLIIYWGGHGVVDNDDARRLLYADATVEDKVNLDITELLKAFRSSKYRNHPRQLIFVDACSTLAEELGWTRSLPKETMPSGAPEPDRDQHALFAASLGQRAINDDALKTGLFSHVLREVLQSTIADGNWPPDSDVIQLMVEQKFTELNASGRTEQIPSYVMYRSRHSERILHDRMHRTTRKKLLVVEDQDGDRLLSLFGDLQCKLIGDLLAFWEISHDIEDFDAALVDLHLGEERIDEDGLCVIEWLAEHTVLPTVVMTAKPSDGMDFGKIERKYNLVGFCTKSPSMSAVRAAVAEALSVGVEDILLSRLEEDLVRRRRVARKLLSRSSAPAPLREEMEREAERISRICERGPLTEARASLRKFDETYCS